MSTATRSSQGGSESLMGPSGPGLGKEQARRRNAAPSRKPWSRLRPPASVARRERSGIRDPVPAGSPGPIVFIRLCRPSVRDKDEKGGRWPTVGSRTEPGTPASEHLGFAGEVPRLARRAESLAREVLRLARKALSFACKAKSFARKVPRLARKAPELCVQGKKLCGQGEKPCGRSSEPRSRAFRPGEAGVYY